MHFTQTVETLSSQDVLIIIMCITYVDKLKEGKKSAFVG